MKKKYIKPCCECEYCMDTEPLMSQSPLLDYPESGSVGVYGDEGHSPSDALSRQLGLWEDEEGLDE